MEKLPKMQQEPANYTYSFARMWKLPKMEDEPATCLQNFAKLEKFLKGERERERISPTGQENTPEDLQEKRLILTKNCKTDTSKTDWTRHVSVHITQTKHCRRKKTTGYWNIEKDTHTQQNIQTLPPAYKLRHTKKK